MCCDRLALYKERVIEEIAGHVVDDKNMIKPYLALDICRNFQQISAPGIVFRHSVESRDYKPFSTLIYVLSSMYSHLCIGR